MKRKGETTTYVDKLKNMETTFVRKMRNDPTEYTPAYDGNTISRGTPYIIDIPEAEEWRKFLYKKSENKFLKKPFNNAHQVVRGDNQVSCSFLGFAAGAYLKNKDYVKQITKYDWNKSLEIDENNEPKWMEVWESMKKIGRNITKNKEGGMPNIAMMLDVLKEQRSEDFNIPIEYIPIRATNDNYYNSEIVTVKNYEKALDKIEDYLKEMIKKHDVVVLNMDSHTRVFFGYFEYEIEDEKKIRKKLLAYDSYTKTQKKLRAIKNGDKLKEKDKKFKFMSKEEVCDDDDIVDVTIGGISLVDLRWAASKVKELVYFKEENTNRRKKRRKRVYNWLHNFKYKLKF